MASRRTVLKSGLVTLGGLSLAPALPRTLFAQTSVEGDWYA